MKFICLILGLSIGVAYGQYPSPPIGGWGSGSVNRPSSYPKQPPSASRPSPFSALASVLPGGSSNANHNGPASYDDPIPQIVHDSSYDTQTLPAKLPILAPNGVVEIYNRVVDDLIKRLELDFSKKEMDPMRVVIRSTPAGPVRVPGYLQRRPFRRPGAALYRGGGVNMPQPPQPLPMSAGQALKKKKKTSRSNPVETVETSRFPEGGRPAVASPAAVASDAVSGDAAEQRQSFRGAGKISTKIIDETTPIPESSEIVAPANSTDNQDQGSSEEGPFIRARSDEYLPEEEIDDEDENAKTAGSLTSTKQKKTKKDETVEEEDDEEKTEGKSTNVDSLMQRYQSKNTKAKAKYSGGTKTKPAEKTEKVKTPPTKNVSKASSEDDDDDDDDDADAEQRDDPDMDVSYNVDAEPGTLPHGGGRPPGGYYPQGGPPAIPAKPNAMLSGLSKMRRSSDVAVSVDARSAMITARLLVGPIHVHINESNEPKERGIKATIPELEAEMILMERHGVVFLQRFTLDRAYGQDVEISIPKVKGADKRRKNSKGSPPGARPGFDGPNGGQDRFQTKMAAHISMEVVKLLRSGNLRVNLMRTAQGSMAKLKLPISKPKSKKAKKEKTKQESSKEKTTTT